MKISVWASTPLPPIYHPELDATPEMSPVDSIYLQSLIRVIRWYEELICIDITCEVSIISSRIAIQR